MNSMFLQETAIFSETTFFLFVKTGIVLCFFQIFLISGLREDNWILISAFVFNLL